MDFPNVDGSSFLTKLNSGSHQHGPSLSSSFPISFLYLCNIQKTLPRPGAFLTQATGTIFPAPFSSIKILLILHSLAQQDWR